MSKDDLMEALPKWFKTNCLKTKETSVLAETEMLRQEALKSLKSPQDNAINAPKPSSLFMNLQN
jgi:hypothetical protein